MTNNHIMLYRLLDANLNRTVEGLRVLEECARMLLNDASLTARIKELRHQTAALIRNNPALDQAVLFARDTIADVLKSGATSSELKRDDLVSLLRANARRAAEAVRALEEYGKLISPDMAVAAKDIRFEIYAVEKDITAAITRSALLSPDRLLLGIDIDCSLGERLVRKHISLTSEIGAGLVLLRAGGLKDREFFGAVIGIAGIVDRDRITLLIAGRADISRAAGADGVVLGNGDLLIHNARDIIGPGRLIGSEVTVDDSEPSDVRDMIDLEIIAGDACHIGGKRQIHVKPRVLTGVLSIETLESLPSGMFDGILMTPNEPYAETIMRAQAVRNIVRRHTEDQSDVSHESAE